MMNSGRFSAALILIGVLFACVTRTFAAGTDDDVVVLPPFQVLNTRPWLYASVPGYEILSLENESGTRRIASDLQRAGRFMPWFFPARLWEEAPGKSILFIDRFSSGRTLNEAQERLKVPKVDLFTANGLDGPIQFASAEVVSTWLSGRRSPSLLWFSAKAHLVRPTIPHWYREGVGTLLSAAKISDTKLEFSGQSMDPSAGLPLNELLAVKTQTEAIERTNQNAPWRPRYNHAAVLFVRWGFFSDAGIRRSAFVEFAASAPDASDESFQRFFGLSVADVQISLQAFAKETGRRSFDLPLPKPVSPAKLAAVVARPATETEVARIVGGSYLSLSRQVGLPESSRDRYRTLARKTLAGADLDLRDPQLQVVLGTQEFLARNFAKAREFTANARRDGLATPHLYFLEAALRLRSLDSGDPNSRALSPAEKEMVLEPLRAGLKLFPGPLESYRILADVHSRGEEDVPSSDLALLLSGARDFPESLDLMAKTALLHFRQGQRDVAAELVTRGLASPGIEKTPQKATLLGLKRKLDEDAIPMLSLPTLPQPER